MTTTNPVEAFFDAERTNDPDALAATFAADAVVEDEGARIAGVPAIRAWWVAAKAQYNHVAEPFETLGAGDKVKVHAKVNGAFPNSPLVLRFDFTLRAGKIAALRIA
ncbi:nuclear transport factor 2 family protein [Zavarzinia sp. CC-PAN008]|uniref:nuclear transport factor 2 family protein n=1 Tax=Zavarzinia sp. CC-PAN008 TaxID=3243332 RepID=UPI003F745FA0